MDLEKHLSAIFKILESPTEATYLPGTPTDLVLRAFELMAFGEHHGRLDRAGMQLARIKFFSQLLGSGLRTLAGAMPLFKAMYFAVSFVSSVLAANYRALWQIRNSKWTKLVRLHGAPEGHLLQAVGEVKRYVESSAREALISWWERVKDSPLLTEDERASIRKGLETLLGFELETPDIQTLMALKEQGVELLWEHPFQLVSLLLPWKTRVRDVYEFAPMYSGRFLEEKPKPTGHELADKLAQELGLSPLLVRRSLEILERAGQSWEGLSEEQRRMLQTLWRDLQDAYDATALLTYIEEDMRLKSPWASLRVVPFGFRLFYKFWPENPKERLSSLTQVLAILQERGTRDILKGEPPGYVLSLGKASEWVAYLAELAYTKIPEIREKLGVQRTIRSQDLPVYTQAVYVYAVERSIRWLMAEAARYARWRDAQEFARHLEGYLDYAIQEAVERCFWANWSITIYNEVIDKVAAKILPFHPSTWMYKPIKGEAAEELLDFWEKELRPELEERLLAALAGANPAALPPLWKPIGHALRVVEELLPFGANDWRWRRAFAYGDYSTPMSSVEAYVEKLLARIEDLIADEVQVLSTARYMWVNYYHFMHYAKELARTLAEQAVGYVIDERPPGTPPPDPAVGWAIELALNEVLTQLGLKDKVSGTTLVELQHRILDQALKDAELGPRLMEVLAEGPSFAPSVVETFARFQEWLEEHTARIAEEFFAPQFQPSVYPAERLTPPVSVPPHPAEEEAEYSPYHAWVDYWVQQILAYFAGADPESTWKLAPEEAWEKGLAALRHALAQALGVDRVWSRDWDMFFDLATPVVLSALESTAWQVRLSRDHFWDPEATRHIEVPEDVKVTWRKKIYRKPSQILHPQEVTTMAAYAVRLLVRVLEPMWHAYQERENAFVEAPAGPGQVSAAELALAVDELVASAKLILWNAADVRLPWVERMALVERAHEELTLWAEARKGELEKLRQADPRVESMERALYSFRRELLAKGEEILTRLSPAVEDPLRLYSDERVEELLNLMAATPALGEPVLEKGILPWSAGRLASPAMLEPYVEEILERWLKVFDASEVSGKVDIAYSRIFDNVDWRTIFPDVPELGRMYHEAKEAFRAKLPELRALVRTVLWQVPLTTTNLGEQVRALEDIVYRLLTWEWEKHWTLWVTQRTGQEPLKFQAGAVIDLRDPQTNEVYYRRTLSELASAPDGLLYKIKAYIVSQDANPAPLERELMRYFSDTWEARRKLVGPMTPAEFSAWLEDLLRDLELEFWTRAASYIQRTPEDELRHWRENIQREDVPLELRYFWWCQAQKMASSPIAREIVELGWDLPLRLGMPKDLNFIERQLLGFKERFTGVMRALVSPVSAGLKVEPLTSLSWSYMERLYYECIYPLERAGLREFLSPDALKWLDLATVMWEKKIVVPDHPAQFEAVHQGFRWALAQAFTDPQYVAFAHLWKGVGPILASMVPASWQGLATWFSLLYTQSLAARAKTLAFVDASGRAYTFEEAKAVADYDFMVSLLESGNVSYFDNRFKFYWLPFMAQEALGWNWPMLGPMGYFLEHGEKLRRLREEKYGRAHP